MQGTDPPVVEVPIGPGLPAPTAAWVEELARSGRVAGVVLTPLPADAGPDQVGAEVGMLTQALTVGVRSVRGADPARFRRVRAVVEALAAARAEEEPA